MSEYNIVLSTDEYMVVSEYVPEQKTAEFEDIIVRNRLKHDETVKLMENSFRDAVFKGTGTDIDRIMPPMSRFGSKRAQSKEQVISELKQYYERYFGL